MTRQGQDEGESRTGVNRLETSTVKRGRTNMIPVVSWQVVPLILFPGNSANTLYIRSQWQTLDRGQMGLSSFSHSALRRIWTVNIPCLASLSVGKRRWTRLSG